VVFALLNWLIDNRCRRSSALCNSFAPPCRLLAINTPLACTSCSEAVVASFNPSLLRIWRSSPVDRQVPMIEQCRCVEKSQILRRPVGAARSSSIWRDISRSPTGRRLAVFDRNASSFGPAETSWLRKDVLALWSIKIASGMTSSRSLVISVEI